MRTPASQVRWKHEYRGFLPKRSDAVDHLREPFEMIQALGPRASTEDRIVGVDRVLHTGANLHEAFSPADLVISTVVYNSVLELACTDVPVLLLSIPRTFDDQSRGGLVTIENA